MEVTCFPKRQAEGDDDDDPLTTEPQPYPLGKVHFPEHSPVISMPFRIPNLEVPDVGNYEIRLFVRREEADELGREWDFISSQYFALER